MELGEKILVNILAHTDAVWLPMRERGLTRNASTHSVRSFYKAAGVVWKSNEPDEASRRAEQRELADMTANGLVKCFRPRRERDVGAKLTDAGEDIARGLCGLPSVYDGFLSLQEVISLTAGHADDMWIAETVLAGVNYGSPDCNYEFMAVENMALPALSRRWLESNSDRKGHVYYRATKLGRELNTVVSKPTIETKEQADCVRLYYQTIKAFVERFGSVRIGDEKDIGGICLPCSIGNLAITFDQIPPSTKITQPSQN